MKSKPIRRRRVASVIARSWSQPTRRMLKKKFGPADYLGEKRSYGAWAEGVRGEVEMAFHQMRERKRYIKQGMSILTKACRMTGIFGEKRKKVVEIMKKHHFFLTRDEKYIKSQTVTAYTELSTILGSVQARVFLTLYNHTDRIERKWSHKNSLKAIDQDLMDRKYLQHERYF